MYRYVKIQLRREWTISMMFLHSGAEYTDWTELKPLNPLNHLNILNPLNHLNHLNHLNILNLYPGHKTKT